MAEDFSGGAAERGWQALRRLRILFEVALIPFGVLAFPRGAGGLFGVFLFLAAAFVGVVVAGLLSRPPARKRRAMKHYRSPPLMEVGDDRYVLWVDPSEKRLAAALRASEGRQVEVTGYVRTVATIYMRGPLLRVLSVRPVE